ncbi:hypothetical protein Ccrd_023161 [Cynara cardunculus var. scolymus]|uniref:Uncharacterized protein n=1 Tax=Cynara cardunculus var. scolymus TaxID=59895 RepID=A0A103XXD2_CYNCS|nr:hypothetical protein Ccrd_023161 [Cynara cardunculus var. scolymus]
MDYRSMKRRELQALSKAHNIPANSANSVLADKLSELLNEKQKPTSRQRTCMKSVVETTDVSEPAVSRRQTKKVRFSPNNDLVEYELRSGKKKKDMVTETEHRRKSVAKSVVDNINTVDGSVQIPVRLTRSRVQGKDDSIPIYEKKQGKRTVKVVRKETDAVKELEGHLGKVTRSKVHTLGKGGGVQLDENKQNKGAVKDVEKAGESVDRTEVGRVRVTRSKAQILMEDGVGPNLNPQVKKKSGRGVVNDVDNVEPSKEVMDVPVRVTRSRGKTLTDDVANMVAVTQAEKKITRRETKVSDPSNNLSNVASENNQELPRRKSSRGRGVEIATEDVSEKLGHGKRKKRSEESTAEVSESQHHADKESKRNKAKVEDFTLLNPSVSKVEMVVERKVTRSKALLAMKSSEGNNKSIAKNKVEVQRESTMAQQLEEPLEHAGRKNVNRRKSVMQPENTEVVLHLEEYMNRPARKDTRRKSAMQKVKGKGIYKPLVEKKEVVKEIKMVESPNIGTRKTAGKRKSKEQSGNLSVLDEGLEDEENVTGSGKDATENEIKAVASVTRSHQSKKQRGNPVIEDQNIETVCVSPVDESPRRPTRSASKSEGKSVPYSFQNFVAGKQQDSSVTTPALRMDNQGAVESEFIEGHRSASRTIISGAIIKDNSSKRRAKLSESKPSDSEELAEKFSTEGASVSKSENLELDEKVTEIARTPAIEESIRRLTRSAIRSERNAAANTTPGRMTRSGIKHRENAGSRLFEMVDKEKQQSQSAHQRQPLADARMFSPEVTGVGAHPDVTNSREDRASMREAAIVMENVSLVSAEDASGRAPGEVMEVAGADIEKSRVQFTCSAAKNETSATPYLTENLLSGMQQSSVDLPNIEDETGINLSDIKGTPFSTAEVAETMPDVHDQNEEVYVKSATFSEAQVQVAVDLEKSVVKSARPESYVEEMELTTKRLQTDVMVEEPAVSIPSVDISPGVITKGNNDDADNNSDSISCEAGPSAVCHASFKESYDKRKSKEMEALLEPSMIEDDKQFIADNGSYAQIEKGSKQDVVAFNDPLQNPSAGKQEVADNDAHNDDDDDDEGANARKQSMDESVSEDNRVDGSIDMLPSSDMGSRCVAGRVEAQVMDSLWEQSTNKYASQTPAEKVYDTEANGDDPLQKSTGDDVLQGLPMDENDIKDGMVATQDSLAENDVKDDMVATQDNLAEQSELSIGKNTTYVTDDKVDNVKELKSEVMPSASNDVFQIPILNNSDGEDGMVNATKACETDLIPSTAGNILEDTVLSSGNGEGVNANKEHESNSKLSTDNDDDFNMTMEVEPISEPSTTNDILETPISGNGIDDECDNPNNALKSNLKPSTGYDLFGTAVMSKDDEEDDGIYVPNELEPGLGPSNIRNSLEIPVSGNGVDSECVVDEKTDGQNGESEPEPSTIDDNPAMDEHDVGDDEPELTQNENMPVELEVLIRSSDKEAEPVLNVAVDEVQCDIVDVCASVERSDSSPQTPATNGNGITDLVVDINKDAVSKTLGDIDWLENSTGVIDTKNDTSFCGSEQKSKESESISPGMNNEQGTEEAEMMIQNDHVSGDRNALDSDKFKEDCSNHGVDEENIGTPEKPTRDETSPIVYTQEKPNVDKLGSDRFTEDIGVHRGPITEDKEECSVDDTVSDPPTFFKDDDINMQGSFIFSLSCSMVHDFVANELSTFAEETQEASTCVDLGNHSFGIDEYQKPDSANECDDALAEIMKDDRVSYLQTSARASSSMEKGFSPAAELANSVTDLEKASRNTADGGFNQDTEEFLNWSDSSLKALFTTPTTNITSNVKHDEEDAVRFTFSDDRSCDDIEIAGRRAHDFDHQWENKTQDPATQSPEYGVSNFEEFSHKYFVDGSSDMSMEKEKKDKPS